MSDVHLKEAKFCPKCGSTDVFWASSVLVFMECRKCGFRGALILEDGRLAAKLRSEWRACVFLKWSRMVLILLDLPGL
jgi:Zn ribbon nucleic-acid-binding protein